MQDWIVPYSTTLSAMAAAGALAFFQLVVADVAGIRAGHTPGAPVVADHGNFLFRATRAHANTNESLGIFGLLALVSILSGSSAEWTGGLAWTWTGARVGHMACYYAGAGLPRSIFFGIGMTALAGMLFAWLLT